MVNFIKNRKSLYSKIARSSVLTGSIFLLSFSGSLAEEVKPGSEKPENDQKSNLVGLKSTTMSAVNPVNPDGTSMFMPDTTLRGILKNQLVVTGAVRFITIYRDMQKSYADMQTSDRNISFLDYPLANVGTSVTGGYPTLELNLGTRVLKAVNINVGYSFTHSFSGQINSGERKLTSIQNLNFSGQYHAEGVNVSLNAGSNMGMSLSRMTMGQPQYRDNYFERLPWDWYRQSFQRFDDYYGLNTNIGAQNLGNSFVQGFIGSINLYKLGISGSSFFGRSSTGLGIANVSTQFPSYTYAGRLEKVIFTRYVDGRFGFNFYERMADTDRSKKVADNNQIMSVDGRVKIRKVLFTSELALGTVQNPLSNKQQSTGFTFKADFDKRASSIPFSAEFYNIGYNVVSFDGSVLNSNTTARGIGYLNGDFAGTYIYDNYMMINTVQEVGQIANNRRGLILNGEAQVGKLKIQLSTAMSQEIENKCDTVTIQHRVNAFSRSRFRPWFMAGGPYGRIKSVWRRTFETISITDPVSDYKKGFNGVDLLLKYKSTLFGKDVVFMNFYNYNSVQDRFSPIPVFTNDAFIRTFYSDLTVALKLSKKYTVSGFGGIERILGNMRTNLVDATGVDIKDAKGRPTYDPKGKPIDQTGFGLGLGIDYDFSSTSSLHLRHTWMNHKDKNFVYDVFRGQETTFELKIFF